MRKILSSPRAFYCILVSSFAVFCLSQNTIDPDLWGHVRFGTEIIDVGAVPRIDTFSYTAYHRPWINHEWLAEVVFGALYRTLGPGGIILLKIIAMAVLYLIFRGTAEDAARNPLFRSVLALLVISVFSYGAAFRPQLFSFLFFTVLLCVLLKGGSGGFYLVPAFFLVWANCHGGFLVGLAALVLYALFGFVSAARERRPLTMAAMLLVPAASFAATLVTPYGLGLWRFLLRTVFMERPFLAEWRPVPLAGPEFADFKALLIVAIAVMLISRERKKGWLVALTALTALMSLRANRHIPFFAVCCGFLLPAHADSAVARLRDRGSLRAGVPRRLLTPCGIVAAALMLAAIPFYRGWSAVTLLVPESRYPVRAVRWMRENNVSGNCAVFFDWGEYLIWHAAGRARVSIDGRYRTVYPERIIEDNFRFYAVAPGWEELLTRFPTNLALLRNDLPINRYMDVLPDWRLAFRSTTASLYVREKAAPELTGAAVEDLSPPRESPFP